MPPTSQIVNNLAEEIRGERVGKSFKRNPCHPQANSEKDLHKGMCGVTGEVVAGRNGRAINLSQHYI